MIETIPRWDEWFAATGDEESIKCWNAAKSVHNDPVILDRWASIIEMNRLSEMEKSGQGRTQCRPCIEETDNA